MHALGSSLLAGGLMSGHVSLLARKSLLEERDPMLFEYPLSETVFGHIIQECHTIFKLRCNSGKFDAKVFLADRCLQSDESYKAAETEVVVE